MASEGWEAKPLAKLLEKVIDYRGKAPPKAETGTRLITARNVRMGFVSFDHAEFIDEKLYLEWMNRGLPRSGDVMFTTEAPLGNVAMFPDSGTYALGQRIVTLRPRQGVSSGFLFQYLLSDEGQSKVHEKASGSTALGIKSKELVKIIVPFPPLQEQQKIAEILGTWDKAIETTEALLANARTQKRALMQSLLTGTRRFPGFEDHPWREVRLGDIGKTISGGTPESENPAYWDGDIPWATPTDITKLTSRFISSTARMITDAGLKASAAKLVPKGAILVCTRATIGEVAISTAPICTNQGFKNIVLNEGYDADFVYYMLQFFKKELIRYACGSTFLELSKADFDKRAFRFPCLSEQKMIAETLNVAEDEIDEHRQVINHLRTEKKSLMQQLLTGKRRVIA